MNSIKTAFVSLVLLGVLYGMYQVLNTPQPEFDGDGYAFVPEAPPIETGEEIDPQQLFAEGSMTDSTMEVIGPDEAPPLVGDNDSGYEEIEPESLGRFVPPETDSAEPPTGGFQPPARGIAADPSDRSSDGAGNGLTNVEPNAVSPPGGGAFPGLAADRAQPTQTPGFADQSASVPSALGPRSQMELSDSEFARRLTAAWTQVEGLIDQQEFTTALAELSYFYGDSRLSPEEQDNMLTWLDALAAKVIYSTEHHFAEAYIVNGNETLASIAQAHGVPEELLYNINQSRFAADGGLFAGMEIKIVQGPFHGELDLSERTLTVFVNQSYAGRFDIALGDSVELSPGSYRITSRTNGLTGETSALGEHVVTLSNGVRIQGNELGGTAPAGSIGLTMTDMFDVYSILSAESVLTVVE